MSHLSTGEVYSYKYVLFAQFAYNEGHVSI